MDTLPMPLEALAATHGDVEEFRITAPAEVKRLLEMFCSAGMTLNFNAPGGVAVTALLLVVDSAHGLLGFQVQAADAAHLQALINGGQAVVVGFLDNIKLQFDADGLALMRDAGTNALRCDFPRGLWRFQRRNAFRVRPLVRASPLAVLRHPAIADMRLSLRVLDLSIGGCALHLPDDVPPLAPGVQINDVQLRLDGDNNISVNLRLQHVTAIDPQARGSMLGCELVRPSRDAERALQLYIDQTQKRRRLMVLD